MANEKTGFNYKALWMGSALASVVWLGFTFGPQQFSNIGTWWNSKPAMREVAEKVYDMLEDASDWKLAGDNSIAHQTKNVNIDHVTDYMCPVINVDNKYNPDLFTTWESGYIRIRAQKVLKALKEVKAEEVKASTLKVLE